MTSPVYPPNFHSIAEDIFQRAVEAGAHHDRELANVYKLIVEALRVVWNQRGAADLAALDDISVEGDEGAVLLQRVRHVLSARDQ
jgi:hypothetical protein